MGAWRGDFRIFRVQRLNLFYRVFVTAASVYVGFFNLHRISLHVWDLLVYYAFHDQPEEDSGYYDYCCLYRDNAECGLRYLPQKFDT